MTVYSPSVKLAAFFGIILTLTLKILLSAKNRNKMPKCNGNKRKLTTVIACLNIFYLGLFHENTFNKWQIDNCTLDHVTLFTPLHSVSLVMTSTALFKVWLVSVLLSIWTVIELKIYNIRKGIWCLQFLN